MNAQKRRAFAEVPTARNYAKPKFSSKNFFIRCMSELRKYFSGFRRTIFTNFSSALSWFFFFVNLGKNVSNATQRCVTMVVIYRARQRGGFFRVGSTRPGFPGFGPVSGLRIRKSGFRAGYPL